MRRFTKVFIMVFMFITASSLAACAVAPSLTPSSSVGPIAADPSKDSLDPVMIGGEVKGDGALPILSSENEYDTYFQNTLSQQKDWAPTLERNYETVLSPFARTEYELYGIVELNGKIIAADIKQDCLVAFSPTGEVLNKVGTTGNGMSEFLRPTSLVVQNDNIYVLDSGNSRIQIFDKDLNYVKEIKLVRPRTVSELVFCDLAVDNEGNIYVSFMSSLISRILCYPQDYVEGEMPVAVADGFNGFLSEYKGQVYALSHGNTFYEEIRENGELTNIKNGFGPGDSSLFRVYKDRMEKICTLPFAHSFYDFTVNEAGITAIAFARSELELYDFDGNYIKTISTQTPQKQERYSYLTELENGDYYLTGNEVYSFIHFVKKEG